MSQDDPKNTGMAEDNASEAASRRRFLKAGAAAAVGAIAAAVVPKGAEAQSETALDVGVITPNGTRVTPPTVDPADPRNDTLARVIVEAWNNDNFREQLLSDPKNTLAGAPWNLTFANVNVVTRARYHAGYVKTLSQVLYVLPDRPQGLNVSLAVAKVMMQVTPFGM